jgi:hypothetical protein
VCAGNGAVVLLVVEMSRLQAIAEPANSHYMCWFGWVYFNFHSQTANVDVNQSSISKVSVTPNLVEQNFAAEHTIWIVG